MDLDLKTEREREITYRLMPSPHMANSWSYSIFSTHYYYYYYLQSDNSAYDIKITTTEQKKIFF